MAKFFNEMTAETIGTADSTREHYREFHHWLAKQSPERLQRKRAEADLSFRRVGITFAVYGDDAGTERLIPFDIIPRIIPAKEWALLETGLVQRVKALNMFIHDVYHDQNIIKAGLFHRNRSIKMRSTGLRCRAFLLPQISMHISPASILCVQAKVNFTYWKIICAYHPVSPICWKIAK
jgi:uncharacterized circularly permuted ATP-grasp superfamily protein